MSLRFDEIWWLALVLLALPLAWIGVRWMSAMAPTRRWSAVVARVLLLSAIAMLLAGASLVRTTDRIAAVVIVDVSPSVEQFYQPPSDQQGREVSRDTAIAHQIDRLTSACKRDDLLAVLYTDRQPRAVQALAPTAPSSLPQMQSLAEGTDLERALNLAGAMIPPDAVGRILLFSDGNQTSGDVVRAARELASARASSGASTARSTPIPVDVVPLEYRVDQESMVESVDVPPVAPAQASVTVRVVLLASAPVSGELALTENGEPVDINAEQPGFSRRLTLRAGRHVELLTVPLSDARTHRFEAIWQPDPGQDRVQANNTGTAFVVTPGRGGVLLVNAYADEQSTSNEVLAGSLRQSGFEVKAIGSENLLADLLWLQGFDIVVLDDVPADSVGKPVQEALARFVTELGGGLVMVGGPRSFGAGGWKGTPLEPLLPVLLDLPERLETPSSAVVLVIDNSGSMSHSVLGTDRSQQDIANEGAALAIESLDKSDMVGVIVFNSDFDVRVPLQRNLDAKRSAQIVRSISADGGTNLPPALNEAHRQLAQAQAANKHVIVLSDGVSSNKEDIPGIVAEMRADGIKVTTIAVGNIADTDMMARMARDGGGVYYRVVDPTLLPRVFVKAVRIMRSPMIREVPFDPVRLPSGSTTLEGIADLPALLGVTLTQTRKEASVSNVLATPQGEPLLATWSAGLGRVGAFTSDARAWAAPWIATPVYSRFWTQLVRAIARAPSDRAQNLSAALEGDSLRINLEQTDDQAHPMNELIVPASVYAPDGTHLETRLSQIGPGQYQALVPAPNTGTYVVTLAPRQGTKVLSPVIGGVVKPGGAEFRSLSSNVDVLREVAKLTGGRVLSMTDQQSPSPTLFDRAGMVPAVARLPLWQWLLIAAITIMLFDVATRRVAWDRLLTREFGSHVGREAAAGMSDRSQQAARSLRRLREADLAAQEQLSSFDAGTSKLSDQDALATAEAERTRRREAIIAARQAARSAAQPAPAPIEDLSSQAAPESSSAPDEAQPGGLLEAKRRALRRFDKDENQR